MNLSVTNKYLSDSEAGSKTGHAIMALLTDDGKIFAYRFGHWYRTNNEPTNPVTVTASPDGFWCLDSDGNIHRWNEDSADSEWALDINAQNVTALSCDAEGTLWYINRQGDLYFSNFDPSLATGADPRPMALWTKSAYESAWFFDDTWEYTATPGDHLLKIVRAQYNVSDVDAVYHIADEIVRLSKITKKRNSIQAGQKLIMPPLGYR